MAWVAEEDFESYAAGDNWHGGSGGSGFSAAWVIGDTGQEYDIVSSPALEGSRSARTSNSAGDGTGSYQRSLTSTTTTGSVYFLIRTNEFAAANGVRFGLHTVGDTNEYNVDLINGQLILKSSGGDQVIVTGLSTDVTYEVELVYDTTVPNNKARSRTRLSTWGSYTSTVSPAGGSDTAAITEVKGGHLGTDTTINGYLDRISATEEPAATTARKRLMLMGVGS